MTKQKALENYIARELGEVRAMRLNELIDAALDEAAQAEYDAAIREMDEDLEVGVGAQKSLKERYNYLRLGGSWDAYAASDDATSYSTSYLAGFEDAMKTLGVKP